MARDDGEAALVARSAEGDIRAFESLVARHQLPILRHCLGMLGDPGDAEEAAQDTFFAAWRSIGRFRGESSVSTWLYRIATNRCLKHLRRRPPTAPTDTLPERPSVIGNPEAEHDADQALQDVAAAIGCLTPAQRVTLVLREVDGLTYGEIAEILGVPTTAVKSRLNRARVELARLLDGEAGP